MTGSEGMLQVIKNGKAFKPVEGNTGENASEMFTQKIGNSIYIALFNYGSNAKTFTIDAKRLGLSPANSYKLHELLQGNIVHKTPELKLDGGDAALYKLEIEE